MKKNALITGAASGLGYEIALLLAKDGYHLILIDIDKEKLKAVQHDILEVYPIEVDILNKDLSQYNIAEEIKRDLNGKNIDVLVNNAGFGLFGSFAETDWEKEQAMLNLHIHTTTHLTKLMLDGMIKRGSGKILNMSSLAAFQPGPLMSIYYASKGYILSFSEAIANELKGTGVTVTALCPGPTKTAFQQTVSADSSENKITFNMGSAKQVAAYGYKAMQKGKSYAIPGRFNKILATIPRVIPRSTATLIVRTIQAKNRKEA